MDTITKSDIVKRLRSIGEERSLGSIYSSCPYSASKIVAAMHSEFDMEGTARKTYDRHHDDPASPYYNMSVQEIMMDWVRKGEEGRANGMTLDEFIGNTLEPVPDSDARKSALLESALPSGANKCRSFEKFYDGNIRGKLEYVAREKTIYDTGLGINGRFDAVFFAGDNLFLVDWKNSKKIDAYNKFEKMRGPLSEYDASDLNNYTVQLYIYTYILRKSYGLKNVGIVPLLVRIGEDDYEIYRPVIPYSDKLMEDVISFAIGEIKINKRK